MSNIYKEDGTDIIFDEFTRIYYKIIGSSNEIVVKLGKPQKDAVWKFYCPYHIDTPYENIKHRAPGVDELKSIQNAMNMINIELKSIAKTRSLILKRQGHAEGDLGFEEWDIFSLVRTKERLKNNKTLSSDVRRQLEERVRLLEIEEEKRSQARNSNENR